MRLFRRPPITEDARRPAISITPLEGLALARRGREIVAASTKALRLAEGTYADALYFPAGHVNPAAHHPVTGTTSCPWRGEARYFDVAGAPRAAWTYYDATEEGAEIAGRLAFDAAHIDVDTHPLPALPSAAQEVLTFWFEETPPELHFRQDDAFDAAIRERFGVLYEEAISGALDNWQETPAGTLALLILLDQFSRNLFRGGAEAFAQDEKAQAITARLVEKGWDLALDPEERAFAYLTFMHAEDMALQNRSVELYSTRLPGVHNVWHAIDHRQTFHRHGRFPGRDAALGR